MGVGGAGRGEGPSSSSSSFCLPQGTPVMVRVRCHPGGQAPVHPPLTPVTVYGSPAQREDQLPFRERSRDPHRITVQTEVTRVPLLCWHENRPGEISSVSRC